MITHWLHDMSGDNVLAMLRNLNMWNHSEDKVKVIFIPSYLIGNDGIVDMKYYDVILGNDLCIYPSYYEPWGYTPLEAIAFHVPCITTDLAGFGLWANNTIGHNGEILDGVKVIHRDDYNYSEVADAIKTTIMEFSRFTPTEVRKSRKMPKRFPKKRCGVNSSNITHQRTTMHSRKQKREYTNNHTSIQTNYED